MLSKINSAVIYGIDAFPVCVETDVSKGLPFFSMVGMLSNEVKEAKDRVLRAISNSFGDLPPAKITINISPADIKKSGSGFDLPIALSILAANNYISSKAVEEMLFVGELSLDGTINKIKGTLSIALLAKSMGMKAIVVPKNNAFEGAPVKGIEIIGVSNLKELVGQLKTHSLSGIEHIDIEQQLESEYISNNLNYYDVVGQERAKRATMIAVAGFHNLLFVGPPGSGKSMMAQRIPSILDRITIDECLEISKIYSVSGLLKDGKLMSYRPFRSPHHSITGPALVGGSLHIKPGEITLAHKGVLFLDEVAEFKKETLEMLRQPLEDKSITITRSSGQIVFPADFMLVMAMNPCKCGFYPDREHCKCTESDVMKYFGKIRGPILDRVDIWVGTNRIEINELSGKNKGMSSEEMRTLIAKAQDIQKKRFEKQKLLFNSQMDKNEIEQYCKLDHKSEVILEMAYRKYNMSARGYYKILKVARTIADLEASEEICSQHLLEAIGYRNEFVEQ